ncbi:MAG: HNH endonuclease signature motif containing protein, partial [Ilumatobacteraceae bacterium]
RAVRLATDAQYRALVARDGGCRWPGCTVPASWCEVDHLIAWEHGGPTDLDNLVLFCSAHHTVKHMAGTVIIGDANDFELIRPDGVVMWCPPRGVASNAPPCTPPAIPPRTGDSSPPRRLLTLELRPELTG